MFVSRAPVSFSTVGRSLFIILFSTISDSNRVVFLESKLSPNGGGIIWASKNSGHNFTHHALPSGVVIDDVTFHPTKADWMLGYDRLKRNLYISTDFAASWHLLDTGVSPSRYKTSSTIQYMISSHCSGTFGTFQEQIRMKWVDSKAKMNLEPLMLKD